MTSNERIVDKLVYKVVMNLLNGPYEKGHVVLVDIYFT